MLIFYPGDEGVKFYGNGGNRLHDKIASYITHQNTVHTALH
jgi:hypothetical protein